MEALVFFAALLVFGYGLFSALADRTPISSPMVFVAAGLLAGPMGFDLFDVNLESELVQVVAEVTLILVLFTNASTLNLKRLRAEYHIPLRLLGVGLPLTMVLGFLIAIPMFPDMSLWLVAVMAFILSPTDAALGQAVVSSEKVPVKIRDTIGVESGLNDGIALPPIMACMAALTAASGASLDFGYWAGFASMNRLECTIFDTFRGKVMSVQVRSDLPSPLWEIAADVSRKIGCWRRLTSALSER